MLTRSAPKLFKVYEKPQSKRNPFNWPVEIGQTEYLRTIAKQVARINWQKNPCELAATLYQNTILQEERENRQTRRIWIAIARKQELFDGDEFRDVFGDDEG